MKPTTQEVYKGKIFTITHTKIIDSAGVPHIVERCHRPDVVTVIGLTEKNEVVLIREFRPGKSNYVLWLPGGRVDKNEKPEIAAKREFEEETKLTCKKLVLFHKKHPSDSFTNKGYVYIASGLSQLNEVRARDEKGNVDIIILPIRVAAERALAGNLPNEFFCFLLLKLLRKIDN